ncbi:MAG TPA: bacillithiol biosynthesis cysteine-adding enzyme BshC [Acidobacteriaceae bacterium]|nr:bacillithiol biosynthesis cysteine-adding enzyme BshC [Acidobacteriaceae bacterium]
MQHLQSARLHPLHETLDLAIDSAGRPKIGWVGKEHPALTATCYPVTSLPHVSALFRDFVQGPPAPLRRFYSSSCFDQQWMHESPSMDENRRQGIVSLVRDQNRRLGAGDATEANLDRLAAGASAVVTGQQVTLFGGPLLTLLKAATAIRLAAEASCAGRPHVPIFWLATEDHDFEEVNRIVVPCRSGSSADLRTLRLPHHPGPGKPVGNLLLGDDILPVMDQLRQCLGHSAISDAIAKFYTPEATMGSAFAGLISYIFRDHGLVVIDASSRPFHALASSTLRAAIEHAEEFQQALRKRSRELEEYGYHAQVLVSESSSLLFLVDETSGVRHALKKTSRNAWSAASRKYDTSDLLSILENAPERISPNALLRPVMQDTLLPTAAYVGGPAEIAYFAQSQVIYQHVLGRNTAVLPRFSATLIEPRLARLLEHYQLTLPDVFTSGEALAQRLGARFMPVEAKQKLSAAGNTLDQELKALTEWMHEQDAALGHAADIAASKMLYQMNRLRRLSANFTLKRNERLRRNADALCHHLFPHGDLQERALAGVFFLAELQSVLPEALVGQALPGCSGHCALKLP